MGTSWMGLRTSRADEMVRVNMTRSKLSWYGDASDKYSITVNSQI